MSAKLFWQGLKQGFHVFGNTLNQTVTFTLLLITYLIGIGIVALPAKIRKKAFLPFMSEEKVETYWITKNKPQEKDFERLF